MRAIHVIGIVLLTSGSAWADEFDFRIEKNARAIVVPQGFGGLNALHATLLAGSPEDVALSAADLPPGASVSFGSATIPFDREGGFGPYLSTTTLSIVTGPDTPVGTYIVKLVGEGGGSTKSTNFQLEVVPLAGNTIYYVSTSGDDANPGTEAQPFRTIQRGADAASAGDTVVVEPGVYEERVVFHNSGAEGSPITLLGRPGAVIDANQRISGWEPAPEIADGVYKKPMSEMPFSPAVIAYEGKYALWIWWDDIVGCGCGTPFSKLSMPQGDPRWDAVGAYGYADENHGIDDGNPPPPDDSSHTAYLRLRSGGDPDDEDVSFGDSPAIAIHDQSYITVRGFTILNGYMPVHVNAATGIVIEHNVVKGGPRTIQIDRAHQPVVRNNEATLNHYYGEMPTADKDSISMWLLADLRHWSRVHQNGIVAMDRSSSAAIYENHIYESLAGIVGTENTERLDIYDNYIHRFNDYAMALGADQPFTLAIHDNILYEVGLEGWRCDTTNNDALIYFYRNRLYNLTHVCEEGGYHGGSCYDNDLEFNASNATQYIYHNSFIGSVALAISNYFNTSPDGGLPNTWIVNNIFSSTWPFVTWGDEWYAYGPKWHFHYNWLGESSAESDLSPQDALLGQNNLIHDSLMWDQVNPSFVAMGDAKEAGIDLAQPWTMDGIRHPALPGMAPEHFEGAAPDLGWFHVEDTFDEVPGSSGNQGAPGDGSDLLDGDVARGCACRHASRSDAPPWVLLLLSAIAWRRRRALVMVSCACLVACGSESPSDLAGVTTGAVGDVGAGGGGTETGAGGAGGARSDPIDAPVIRGTAYYIATDGDDANDCSAASNPDTPKATFESAQACPLPGDGLVLRGGEYEELAFIMVSGSSWDQPVTIMAHDGEQVIVRGLTLGSTGSPSSYVVVHGIIFDAADTHAVPFNVNWGSHVRVQHCELRNGQHSGLMVAGGGNYELIHVNAHHNGTGPNTACNDPDVNGGQCHGVYLSGPEILIDGGEFHDNEGWGIHLYSHPERVTVRNTKAYNQDVGIGIIGGAGPHELYGNDVYANALGMWFGSPPVNAYDNTIHDNDVGMDIDSGNSITNNVFYQNGEHIAEDGGNVIEGNSMD